MRFMVVGLLVFTLGCAIPFESITIEEEYMTGLDGGPLVIYEVIDGIPYAVGAPEVLKKRLVKCPAKFVDQQTTFKALRKSDSDLVTFSKTTDNSPGVEARKSDVEAISLASETLARVFTTIALEYLRAQAPVGAVAAGALAE